MTLSVPYLGFTVAPKKVNSRKVLEVKSLDAAGPGASCGLQEGDELVAFGETRTPSMGNFKKAYKAQAVPFHSVQVQVQRSDPTTGTSVKKSFQMTIGQQRQEPVDVLPALTTAQDVLAVLDSPVLLQKVKRALFQAVDTTESGLVSRKECLDGIPQCDPFGTFKSQELIRHYNACDPEKSGFLFEEEFEVLAERLLRGVLDHMQGVVDGGRQDSTYSAAAAPASRKSSALALRRQPSRDLPTSLEHVPATPVASAGHSPSQCKPSLWLGFSAVKARARPALYVSHVVEGSAAHRLGVEDGDELLVLTGADSQTVAKIDTLQAYYEAFEEFVETGAGLKVKIWKPSAGAPKVLDLMVGPQPSPRTTPAVVRGAEDLQALVGDAAALRRACGAVCCGLVDRLRCGVASPTDLSAGLRRWLPADCMALLSEDVLVAAWGRYDDQADGYLPMDRVEAVLEALLRLLVQYTATLNTQQPCEVSTSKYRVPVDTHAVYEQWRELGWLSGTFSEAKSSQWTKVSCENHHHLLVSVDRPIHVRSGDQQWTLSPGDEIRIPATSTYAVMSPYDCRYMFGIQARVHPPIPVSFLVEAWGQPIPSQGLLLPWLGFGIERQRFRATLQLKDVLPFGPAGRQGLREKDELVSMAGLPVPDVEAFRRVLRLHVAIGRTVAIQVRRKAPEGPERLVVTVDVKAELKEKQPLPPGPLPACVADPAEAQALVEDKARLGRIARTLFSQADCDDSQAISRSEFLAFLARWLAPPLLAAVDTRELVKAFGRADKERTNFLLAADFPLALYNVLSLLVAPKEPEKEEKEKEKENQRPAPKPTKKPRDTPAASNVAATTTSPTAAPTVPSGHPSSGGLRASSNKGAGRPAGLVAKAAKAPPALLDTPPRPATPPSPVSPPARLRSPVSKRAASV
eukprot:EG_transcript_2513